LMRVELETASMVVLQIGLCQKVWVAEYFPKAWWRVAGRKSYLVEVAH